MQSPHAKLPHLSPNSSSRIKPLKLGSNDSSPRNTTRTFNKTFNSSSSTNMPIQSRFEISTKVSTASFSLANKTSTKASGFNLKPYSIIRSSSPEEGNDLDEILDTNKNLIEQEHTAREFHSKGSLHINTEDIHPRLLESDETPIPQFTEPSQFIETENPRFPNFKIKKVVKTARAGTEPNIEFEPSPKRKLSPRLKDVEKPFLHRTIFGEENWKRKNLCYRKLMKSELEIDNKALLGFPSKIKHFDDYKNIDRIKEVGSLESKTDPITVLQSLSRDNNQLPRLYTINKGLKTKSPTININHFRILDNGSETVSEAFRMVPKLEQAFFSHNGISPRGASKLLDALPKKLKILDFSGNKLGSSGVQQLVRTILEDSAYIVELNLEGNGITDEGGADLFLALKGNVSMKKLNLSRNKLGNDCMKQLAMFLETNDTLDELYLHFNCIQGPGGETMIKGLTKNRNISVFDISFNSIGVKEKNLGKCLKDLFSINTNLVHCDFSFNQINYAATQMAAKGLEENHKIYGIHWIGNDGYMDPDGFLIAQKKTQLELYYAGSPVSKMRINGTKCLIKPHNTEKPYLKENCWICEGWQELTIHYIPDYRGLHMNRNEESLFEITRMVPPGERKYFFTHNSVASIAQDQGVLKNFIPKIKGVKIEQQKIDIFLPEINFQTQKIEANEDDDFYVPTVKPRMKEVEDDGIKPWRFEDSVFREYKKEDDEYLEKCFIFDLTNSKIAKLIKDPKDLQSIRDMLWKVYRQIKDTYKYFSAIGVSGDLFSIPVNAFTDFLNQGNIVDNKNLKLADTDLLFITTNTVMVKQAFNPDRALVRYQFMEILVRLAMDKYFKTKISPTPPDALQNLFSDMRKVLNMTAVNEWRTRYLWNHKCDLVFKSYLPILKDAYHRYSGQKTKPGMKKFMCLDELRRFCVDSQLLGDQFQDREIFLAYNFSVMLQIDEVNNDRHLQMYFTEFIEAFARIADRCALIPYSSKDRNRKENYHRRSKIDLHYKIEGLFERVFRTSSSRELRETFSMPTSSIFGEEMRQTILDLDDDENQLSPTKIFNRSQSSIRQTE